MKNTSLLFISLVFFIQCSSLKVTSDYDGSADFGSYKTFSYYGWAKESDKVVNDLDKRRIEKAFYEELTRRGMELVQEGGDVVVSLFIVVDQKTAVTAYNNHYGMGGFGGFGGWGWGMGYTTTDFQEHDYYVGTLVCDVFDARTKQLVWQGVAAGEIKENRKQRERNIPLVIKEIMKKYPIKPTS
jgi:hypothetical protein